MIERMERDAIIATLREAGRSSGIAVMIEIDPDRHGHMDLFDSVGIVHGIEDLFPRCRLCPLEKAERSTMSATASFRRGSSRKNTISLGSAQTLKTFHAVRPGGRDADAFLSRHAARAAARVRACQRSDHLAAGITRMLDIISEASRHVDVAVRDGHRELPWRAIRGSGNSCRHDCDNVAESHVWTSVIDRLPSSLAVAVEEIDRLDGRS